MAFLMAVTIGSKAVLLAACAALAGVSDVAKTLALDHLNDVLSNSVALLAALLASWHHDELWWTDAAGAIAVSLYIIYSWLGLANEQIGRLVGMGAPDSFVQVGFRVTHIRVAVRTTCVIKHPVHRASLSWAVPSIST